MYSIKDILAEKDFSIPDEVKIIKLFIKEKYKQDIEIKLTTREIVISSPSAALISSLRLNSLELIKVAQTDKKIRFRIV